MPFRSVPTLIISSDWWTLLPNKCPWPVLISLILMAMMPNKPIPQYMTSPFYCKKPYNSHNACFLWAPNNISLKPNQMLGAKWKLDSCVGWIQTGFFGNKSMLWGKPASQKVQEGAWLQSTTQRNNYTTLLWLGVQKNNLLLKKLKKLLIKLC